MPITSADSPPPSDALAKLRIRRDESRSGGSSGAWFLKTVFWLVVLCILLAGIGWAGMAVAGGKLSLGQGWGTQDWSVLPESMQARLEVRLALVKVETGRSADATVKATGYLESLRQAKIGARATGRIEAVHVEEGSRVKAGQILAVLEHADLDASLAAIEASLSRAKAAKQEQEITIQQNQRDFERIEKLRNSQIATETDYEERKFKLESAVARRDSLVADIALAEARVREAEQMKANMFIKAPFDGTVISKDAEVGESILPGGMGEASGRGSAVTVADLEHLEVECDVKESYISRVIPGQSAEVAVDAVPEFRYQGRVRKIIPMGDRARATIKVKVEIINVDERLFPNMSATVYFLPAQTEKEPETPISRIFCDSKAIQQDDTGSFVWTLDDQDRLQRIDLNIGADRDDRTEILKGLTGSERVVIAPAEAKSGQRVKLNR
jgi:RND family efflux transporter MFP subunit